MPHGLEQAQRAQADDVGRVKRLIERDADVALGTEVIDLVGPDLLHDHRRGWRRRPGRRSEGGTARAIEVASEEMVDALAIQAAGAPDQPVDLVVGLAEQELGEIRPVLAGDSGDQMHVS